MHIGPAGVGVWGHGKWRNRIYRRTAQGKAQNALVCGIDQADMIGYHLQLMRISIKPCDQNLRLSKHAAIKSQTNDPSHVDAAVAMATIFVNIDMPVMMAYSEKPAVQHWYQLPFGYGEHPAICRYQPEEARQIGRRHAHAAVSIIGPGQCGADRPASVIVKSVRHAVASRSQNGPDNIYVAHRCD